MRVFASLYAGIAASVVLHILPVQAATEKVLYSFCSQQNCTDGESPYAGVLNVKGTLYATTTDGGDGNNQGTLVSIDMETGTATFIYTFANYAGDGAVPEADPIDVGGIFYGTTSGGGKGDGGNGAGTIYSLDPTTGTEKVSYSFCKEKNCVDGALPTASLLDLNGLFYGTTALGGGNVGGCYGERPGCGTVFSFDPATGTEKVLYAFCKLSSCADGSEPAGSLIAVNGTLFGTTTEGGRGGSACNDMDLGCGTVFAVDPQTGTETVLYAFSGGLDGGLPAADLINVNGMLYGTTELGGSNTPCGNGEGCGTVFSIDPTSGAETIIHSFRNNGKDGQNPLAGLIELKGKLYGTTENGGTHGSGTVFAVDLKTGKEKVVYSFCVQQKCTDGAAPYADLIAVKGTLYGTTEGGGTGYLGGGGTVFSITP